MAASERCWLVERDYGDEDLVTLVYATTDGSRQVTRQLSATMLANDSITAAREVPTERLTPVRDEDRRRRYAREARRMADSHDPDEMV